MGEAKREEVLLAQDRNEHLTRDRAEQPPQHGDQDRGEQSDQHSQRRSRAPFVVDPCGDGEEHTENTGSNSHEGEHFSENDSDIPAAQLPVLRIAPRSAEEPLQCASKLEVPQSMNGQVVQRLGIRGIQLQRRPIRSLGLVPQAHVIQDRAAPNERFDVLRIQP